MAAAAAGAGCGFQTAYGNGGIIGGGAARHWCLQQRKIPVRTLVKGEAAVQLREKKLKEKEFAAKVMAAYDEDKSGQLEQLELKSCLSDYAETVHHVHRQPSEDDLVFLLLLCGSGDQKTVKLDDLSRALSIWDHLLSHTNKVLDLFRKNDKDGNCQIDRGELAIILLKLNRSPVPVETIDWVLAMGDLSGDGRLDAEELVRAVAAWYGAEEEEPVNRSKVCIVL